MTASILHRYEREQARLVQACCPTSGRGDYDVPAINQAALLARIERQVLQRKGGR